MDTASSLLSTATRVAFGPERVILIVGSQRDADALIEESPMDLARFADSFQQRLCEVRWEENWDGGKGYEVYASALDKRRARKMGTKGDRQTLRLLDQGYEGVMEFLLEESRAGKIVIFTSDVTDQCIHTNDALKEGRAIWKPRQFRGYNYLTSWRRNQLDPGTDITREHEDRINPEYFRLREALRRDRVVDFEYSLVRPPAPDELFGAVCSYRTRYYLATYQEEPIRIGVSDPKDYRVLVPGVKRA